MLTSLTTGMAPPADFPAGPADFGDAGMMLRRCLLAGIEAAQPSTVCDHCLSVRDDQVTIDPVCGPSTTFSITAYDRIFIVGGGNAAGGLAGALESRLGDAIDDGVIVTDLPVGLTRIQEYTGNHPIPSPTGAEGAHAVYECATAAGADDLVLGVLTGGGSALLPAPAGTLSLEAIQQVTDALLTAGASIDELNTVRKHCSLLKGGGLAAAAAPATVIGLTISDVVGNDPSVIASGPLVGDPTTYADALAVLDAYAISAPAIREHLQAGVDDVYSETPSETAARSYILATNDTALTAAARVATDAGINTRILTSRFQGDAQARGRTCGTIAAECYDRHRPFRPPAVLLSGGETTVTASSTTGTGGPNQEFALGAACRLHELGLSDAPIAIAAVDTDGIDGPTDAAGALLTPASITHAAATAALDAHNVTPFLADRELLIQTGSTGTNVNDLRAIFIGPTEP